MKELWRRFLKWCADKFGRIARWNFEIAFEKVPDALREMPWYLALPACLAFSAAWIVPFGLVTLVLDVLLFPFAAYEELCEFEGEASRKLCETMQMVLSLIIVCVMAVFYLVFTRFVGCLAMWYAALG